MSFDYGKIDFNTRLLVKEMIKRGISISFLGDTNIIVAKYEEHTEYLDETNMNIFGYMNKFLLDNKYTTKLLLQKAGISTAEGKKFKGDQFTEALQYAEKIGFPVVIKPTMGTHGTQVFIGIEKREEFIKAFRSVKEYTAGNYFNDILIERHFTGEEFRCFIDRNGFYAVSHREPANVIGNGKDSIKQLIDAENYKRMNPRNYCLCTIKIDDITIGHLDKKGLNLDYIPKNGKKIYVRLNSNVCTGGNCRDVTDEIHESIIEISKKALNCIPNTPFIGLDLMTNDIATEQTSTSYIICEINANPGISLHTHEETENFRDVPRAIIDLLFPETKE